MLHYDWQLVLKDHNDFVFHYDWQLVLKDHNGKSGNNFSYVCVILGIDRQAMVTF